MSQSKTPASHHPWAIVLLLAACGAAAPAAALEADEVRGEIVEVQPDANRLRLEVSEAGEDRSAREGRVETYQFDDSTEIRIDDPTRSVIDPLTLEISDLTSGDTVRLDFEEIDGQRVARGVDVEESGSSDMAGADTDDEAGATASAETASDDGSQDRTSDMAAMESSSGSQSRDTLPSTASVLPMLAIFGAGFGGLALLIRLRRR